MRRGKTELTAWLLVFHIFGFVLWVGGLLVTTITLARHAQETSPEARVILARLERAFMRGLADPGALIAIVIGAVLVSRNSTYYLHAGWLHVKLFSVLVLLVLHGIVGTRGKALNSGQSGFRRTHARMLFAAIVIVFLMILIATLPGEVFFT